MASSSEKLASVRKILSEQGLDGFLLPYSDAYQNEFLPPDAKLLAWLTGFTGSAGFAVILKDKACVFSDGRYTLQLKKEIDARLYEMADMTVYPPEKWLAGNAGAGAKIGYDPWLSTPEQLARVEKEAALVTLVAVDNNPVGTVWTDRPESKRGTVEVFPEKFAGRSAADKCKVLGADLKKQGVSAALISMPDSIAWLLNVRGNDVPYVPVVLSYLVLHADGGADWFINARRVSVEVKKHIGNVRIVAPGDMEATLRKLSGPVLVDPRRSAVKLKQILESAKIAVKEGTDPCIEPRAIKTEAELNGIREAHLRDAQAMARFLHWVDTANDQTESSIGEKTQAFRALSNTYRGPSFTPIVGFNENGAIVHYHVPEGQTGKKIQKPGLLLIDSGGQYMDGTTDITRTVAIGQPTADMKTQFTRVLKGHIAVATACFPEGTTGVQVDSLARQPLWQAGQDFAHGTGHGVGTYLGVHEDSANISPRGTKAFKPGMVITNEPGYYREGEFGIRIENVLIVRNAGISPDTKKRMLVFETVTFAPIDLRLVDASMLSDEEKEWLNAYHAQVFKVVSPQLEPAVKAWLKEATEKI